MGIFDASISSGGSINSAQSSGWSNSGTMADAARAWSEQAANTAYANNLAAMREQMAFNAAEAQKQRDWQERMANTVYTRSVANMKEAGINPILAANMGLSGAAVGSGATASIGGGGFSPLAQNYMDSWSAAQNASESHGSSWNSSESGLVTALEAMGGMISGLLGNIQSAFNIDMNLSGLEWLFKDKDGSGSGSGSGEGKTLLEQAIDQAHNALGQAGEALARHYTTRGNENSHQTYNPRPSLAESVWH